MTQLEMLLVPPDPEKVVCCSACGQKIRKLNPHRMCAQKVRMLEILAKAGDWVFVEHGRGAAPAGSALQIAPYRAEAHASRLSWFGLAEHGPVRSGLYRATPKGIAFMLGNAVVPKVIWCKDGQVVEEDSEMVSIASIKNVVLDKDYWDRYASYQKYGGIQGEARA